MKKREILYLKETGRAECPACLRAAAERIKALKLSHAVAATSSGWTALELARALRRAKSGAKVVGIHYAANYAAKWTKLDPKLVKKAEDLGVVFTTAGHAMAGINSAIFDRFGTLTPGKLVANTYFTIGRGFKVAVEVALMACDQMLVPMGKEVMALGGTSRGADTALVVKAACSAEFFDLRVREVVCMPRLGRKTF